MHAGPASGHAAVEVDRPVPWPGRCWCPHGWAWPHTLTALPSSSWVGADRVDPAARVATTPRRQQLKPCARPDSGSTWSCGPDLART